MLITGFEGYGGRSDNPSEKVAKAMDGLSMGDVVVNAAVLPVTNHNLRENIVTLIDQYQPATVICLGLAPGEKMIRLERLAANYSRFEIKDNAGEIKHGSIIDSGPDAYQTTLPLDQLQSVVLECGIPARVSHSAGTFLCNAVMFHALDYCAANYPETRCGFIHLPYMPSQVRDLVSNNQKKKTSELEHRSDLSSMALSDQIEAITAIAKSLAK